MATDRWGGCGKAILIAIKDRAGQHKKALSLESPGLAISLEFLLIYKHYIYFPFCYSGRILRWRSCPVSCESWIERKLIMKNKSDVGTSCGTIGFVKPYWYSNYPLMTIH